MEEESEIKSSTKEETKDKEIKDNPEESKKIQVLEPCELKKLIESEIQKEEKKPKGDAIIIRALEPLLFEVKLEDFMPLTEKEREIDTDIRSEEILSLSEFGPCYGCFLKGNLYHRIYLCSNCSANFENAVQKGETVICYHRCYSSDCSVCLMNKIFKYISADVVTGFSPSVYTMNQIKEYIQKGNKDITLDQLGSLDIRLMKYLDDCLDYFLDWIWEQGDIFQLTKEVAIELMKKYEYRSQFIAFVISLIGCHEAIKVEQGYIKLEDIESHYLRCVAISASQAVRPLSDLGWTSQELYLVKLLTFFHIGDADLPVSFTAKRLADGYWSLLGNIINDDDKLESFKDLLSVGEEYQACFEKDSAICSDGSRVDRWVERKRDWTPFLQQIPRTDDFYGIEPFVLFLNKNYFDCHDIAWNLLSEYFNIHDAKLIIKANLEKLHAYVCAVTFVEKERETFDDMGIYMLKKKFQGLREILDSGGLGFRKLTRTLQLLLLTDPVPELCKKMRYASPVFLRKIFHQCLAILTKIDISLIRCLAPYEGISGFTPNHAISAHNLNLTYFIVLIRDIVDFFCKNTFCYLLDVKFWLGEK